MSLLNLLILSLATWRLAYLLAKEDGPQQLIARLRARFYLPDCLYCLSVWCAPVVYALLVTPAAPLAYLLAASGGACLLHRYTGGDYA